MHEVYHSQAQQNSARVDRALAALDGSPGAADADVSGLPETIPFKRQPPTSRRRWVTGLLSAAALLLAAFFLWTNPQAPTAEAAVLEASRIAEQPTDRQYRVIARGGDLQTKLPLPMAVETQAMLYVRGDRFAIRFRNPLGAIVWSGCQGDECWLVPPIGPVLTGERLETLGQRLLGRDADADQPDERLPVLHLSRILQRMPEHYELDWLPDEPSGPGGPICRRIAGRRRVDSELWPERIDLWIAIGSAVVERALLTWQAADDRVIGSLDVQLVGREPQPDDFYTHAAHHAGDRPVLQLPRQHRK